MAHLVFLLVALGLTPPPPQQHDSHQPAAEKPAVLMSGIGRLHHPIATRSPEAQRFFDQGLTLVYGFNHDEAVRAFRRAAQLDPASPMPHWGIALALGPNINQDVDPEREKAAYDAAQRALNLAAGAPANERAYVAAIVTRYSNDPKADLKKAAPPAKQDPRANGKKSKPGVRVITPPEEIPAEKKSPVAPASAKAEPTPEPAKPEPPRTQAVPPAAAKPETLKAAAASDPPDHCQMFIDPSAS